ncbi:MAG: hypothetical protein DA394_05190 [Candidatus Arcticimaribacter sp.]|nr:MAG: hypothetical protein DA394_05190 [Candidatus Arcticimaribacter sp.]
MLSDDLCRFGRVLAGNALGVQVKSDALDLDDPILILSTLESLSYLAYKNKDYNKALEYMHEAEAYHRKKANKIALAPVLNNLGILYRNTGNKEKANYYHDEALRIYKENEDVFVASKSHSNMGRITEDIGNFNKQKNQLNYVSFHIEFKNDTGFLFTTGSIFFRKKQQNAIKFLVQAELKYTAATAKAAPKMTTSSDVRVLEKDKEISRKEIRDQLNRLYYQIKVESTIEVFNFKPEAFAMKIDKLVGGTLYKSYKKWDFKSEITQEAIRKIK